MKKPDKKKLRPVSRSRSQKKVKKPVYESEADDRPIEHFFWRANPLRIK